jgi:hypothetical protein
MYLDTVAFHRVPPGTNRDPVEKPLHEGHEENELAKRKY